ncbi:Transposase, Mutator family [Sedimentitalea nanhaiensis]|uniref:Mutator family transposase n=1 Tax=Sedimentitalea nanhaiensis TaxID=999627 RepID=A0A1I7CRC0_9RHOB|nr:Transposase, Mutator family [Sedimentitalea nanhaiensis]
MRDCGHLPPAIIVPTGTPAVKCIKKAALAGPIFNFDIQDIQPDVPVTNGTILEAPIPPRIFPPCPYTTNTIESLNRVIRKPIKTRGSFPTDDAAAKLIYLAIRNFEKDGRNLREWYAARNQFAIMFEERFNA